jgi:hypothetical protein
MVHQLCAKNIAKYVTFVNKKIVLAMQLKNSFQRMYTRYDVNVEYVNDNSYH